MIECYFDDSGKESEAGHRIVVMAGYVAGADMPWQRLNHSWRHLLLKHGLPDVHMKEILKHAKEKGWDLPALNIVLGDFIAAIKDADLIGFGIAIDADAYRVLPSERRKKFGDAQDFCFSRILRRIRAQCEEMGEPNELMSITFDRDFDFARRRVTLVQELSKWAPEVGRNLIQLSFGDSKFFYALQAADLLAWETRRELLNRLDGRPSSPRWTDLMTALPYGQMVYRGEHWTAERIEKEFSAIEAWHSRELAKLRGAE